MKTLGVVTLLLTFCLVATPAAARTRLTQEGEAERLTTEEEQEARALAHLFVERFRETNDITPLVEELFVEDFAERLRLDSDSLPMSFLRREVALQATPAELRKFYAAGFNFIVLTLEHWLSRPEEPDGVEGDPTLEQMFPHEVASVLRSDPHFAAFITGEDPASGEPKKEAAESSAESPDAAGPDEAKSKDEKRDNDDDDRFVTSLTMLREMTLTTEKAAEALRPHVPPFASMLEAQRERIADEDLTEVDTPHLERFGEAFYGFPTGTRLIHLHVEPLHDLRLQLYAVRVDGRLRILAAFPVLGD